MIGRMRALASPIAALATLIIAGSLAGQPGPGLPSTVFPPGDLFRQIAVIGQGGKHGQPMMHDGYLVTLQSGPYGRVSFYDISDPYLPQYVNSISGPGVEIPEAHDWAQTTAFGGKHAVLIHGFGPAAGGGGTGFSIWDWTDVRNPVLESVFDLPGVPGGYATGVWFIAVQAPYLFVPAGTHGLFVVDASDPKNPFVAHHMPTSQTGGFNAVLAYVVGNTLVVTNNDLAEGIARFDIADPVLPQLLSSIPNAPPPYGARVNGGMLLTPSINGTLYLHDLDDPLFPIVGRLSLGYRMSSAVVQDEFIHLGGSNSPSPYYKVDASNPAAMKLVGQATSTYSDSDWLTPLGHIVAVGDDEGGGTRLIPHQSAPDSRGPVVNMVSPVDGATNQLPSTRVGLTLTDVIELGSIDRDSFIVRPVGGEAVRGGYTNQFGVVNFCPDRPLAPDTLYEVVVPAGGMRDVAGNPVEETFVSRFQTGRERVRVQIRPNPAVLVGTPLTFTVASVSGPGELLYTWDFGDGTPPSAPSASPVANHVYAAVGHYRVLVTVTNGEATGTSSYVQTIHAELTPLPPTRSSTIAISGDDSVVYAVNADNNSVTAIGAMSGVKIARKVVGTRPRTLAVAADDTIWVACQGPSTATSTAGFPTVVVMEPFPGKILKRIALPRGSAPYGIAMSPDGQVAYVTLTATGQVAKLDVATRTWVDTVDVGPDPKGIAVSADSKRIFVTRFRSSGRPVSLSDDRRPRPIAEVHELSSQPFAYRGRIPLALDPGPDTEASGRGLPNYLNSLAISPDGSRMWVPSKKDNIERGTFRGEQPLTFESTVRTIVSEIDLGTNRERLAARIDFNDSDMAFAASFSGLGDYAFVALQGSNSVEVRDVYDGDLVASVDQTGLAPQGLVLTSDGSRLFVHNFMSRSVAIYDVSGVTRGTGFGMPRLASVKTVDNDLLSPEVLLGKQIFYNAADPRMSRDGYMSCASCHLDGGQDGRVWDFTDRGEGLRNTITLEGRAGMAHGNLHWTANFDEVQDFENDIRSAFGGTGFMTNAAFESGTVALPLGQPKAGLSPELDALAAYVASLAAFGESPHRASSGQLTISGARGRTLFGQLGCGSCHSGMSFTDGKLHDVGTMSVGSGAASGGPLVGLETPTLRGLWKTAPYLHDGSAPTLAHVLLQRNPRGQHGATAGLGERQLRDLLSYLLQIDDLEPAPR